MNGDLHGSPLAVVPRQRGLTIVSVIVFPLSAIVDLMHVEFEIEWWATRMWLRRKWRRTLIRLHLRKPYDGPNYVQLFGPITLTDNLYEPTPYEVPFADAEGKVPTLDELARRHDDLDDQADS